MDKIKNHLYIAEGSTTSGNKKNSHDPSTLQFSLHHKENKYALKIKKCFESLNCKVNIINRTESKTKVILISNIDLCDAFINLFGKHCQNKHIPRILLDLPIKKLEHIWQGVMDGDGYKKENSLHQTSNQLVWDMFEMSMRLGKFPLIYSKIKQNSRKDSYIIGFGKNGKHFQRCYNKGLYLTPIKKIEKIKNHL